MKAFPAVKAVIAIMAVIAIIIVSAVVALAESDGVEDEVGLLAVNASAGMTPDSVLYGLDRAIERLELLLAKNRTRKGIEHALERHLEVRAMILAGKEEHALRALDAAEDMEGRLPNHIRASLWVRRDAVHEEYASAFGRSVADSRMLRQQGLLASSAKRNSTGGYGANAGRY